MSDSTCPGNSSCSSRGCWPGTGRRSAPGKVPAAWAVTGRRCLAWPRYRDKADIPRLGAGFGLSQATSYRSVAEITTVVAAEAPGLEEALERAVAEGTPYVILDGKIVSAGAARKP